MQHKMEKNIPSSSSAKIGGRVELGPETRDPTSCCRRRRFSLLLGWASRSRSLSLSLSLIRSSISLFTANGSPNGVSEGGGDAGGMMEEHC